MITVYMKDGRQDSLACAKCAKAESAITVIGSKGSTVNIRNVGPESDALTMAVCWLYSIWRVKSESAIAPQERNQANALVELLNSEQKDVPLTTVLDLSHARCEL